jgi:hypothetical protein
LAQQDLLDAKYSCGTYYLEDSLESTVLLFIGLESYLDHTGRPTHELETKHFSVKLRFLDSEVPAQCAFMAFEVNSPPIRRFELPLDQEISTLTILHFLTIFLLLKGDLEVFPIRARDGNVRK